MDNTLAEGVLLQREEAYAELRGIKERHLVEEREQYSKIKALELLAQHHCTHPAIRKDTFEDYHNRLEWTTEICVVCNKQLRRY